MAYFTDDLPVTQLSSQSYSSVARMCFPSLLLERYCIVQLKPLAYEDAAITICLFERLEIEDGGI